MSDKQFIQQAISLATENVKVGGRPFGAVIVKNGQVIAHAVNQICNGYLSIAGSP
ncbi:deaminase [Proteus mirabilis]|uniref:deaminase n=1 Tax=Proteus mirabilis TaxID=584 RepID=UPI00200E3803|nr:deaminase [Proteus mirabilis]UPW77097.1 deaminase [Proteus mirabilis]UPW81000.1 deaminase [Proteus mirabilis]